MTQASNSVTYIHLYPLQSKVLSHAAIHLTLTCLWLSYSHTHFTDERNRRRSLNVSPDDFSRASHTVFPRGLLLPWGALTIWTEGIRLCQGKEMTCWFLFCLTHTYAYSHRKHLLVQWVDKFRIGEKTECLTWSVRGLPLVVFSLRWTFPMTSKFERCKEVQGADSSNDGQ